MNRSRGSLLMLCAAWMLVPPIVWAGKPSGGGGGADNVAPGPVTILGDVQPTARALTLKFTAPGDDGMSGTASAYDIYYFQGTCAAAPPNPTSWTLAPRTNLNGVVQTLPRPGGTTDFFNVRSGDLDGNGLGGEGLRSGTPYCVAIRGRDEVGNTGPFSVVDADTLGDVSGTDWPLARLGLPANIQAIKLQVAYPEVTSPPNNAVLGWLSYVRNNQNPPVTSMEFAFEGGGRYPVASGINIYTDSFRMVGIPGTANVGAVFTGVPSGSTSNQYMLVEVGPDGPLRSAPETIASGPSQTGVLERGPAGGITYVGHDGVRNPVVALNRVATMTVSRGKTYQVSQLELRERVGGVGGDWASPTTPPTVVLTHRRTSAENGYYDDVELFIKPDGTPDGTLGFLAPQCGIWIYAERRHSDPFDPNKWVWRYWDVGPTTFAYNLALDQQPRVTFDENGAPVLARRSGVHLFGEILQINHPDLNVGGSDTPPPETCSTATSVHPDAWETVGAPTAYLGYLSAVAEKDGDVYLTADQELEASGPPEERLIYRCHGETQWNVASIDRVDTCCTAARAPLFAPDASIVKAYNWGFSGTGTTYSTLPQDYVFLAKQPNNYCPSP